MYSTAPSRSNHSLPKSTLMASASAAPSLAFSVSLRPPTSKIPILPPIQTQNPPKTNLLRIRSQFHRPLEEIYNVRVERGVSKDRLKDLGVSRWSTWRTGKCQLPWDWHVDQLVYVVSGEVRVVPEGAKTGENYMRFVAGDLVRYPKWFEADLFFDGPYEEKYRFLAYGDD